jgi:hypothetical protein
MVVRGLFTWSFVGGSVSSPRRPAGRFLWPPRKLPARSEPDPRTFDRDLAEHAEHVAGATCISDEPERVDSAAILTYAENARRHETIRYAAELTDRRRARLLLTEEDRLRDAQRRAKAQHRTDLRGEFLAIAKDLERSARGGRRLSVRGLERLERVEAVLDRAPDLDDAA